MIPNITKTTAANELLGFWYTPRPWFIILLLVVINPVLSGYSWGYPSRDWRHPDDDKGVPEFEVTTPSITALVGQPVYLPCRVSWIRSRDLHILTSGTLTYTSDSRFEVLHVPGSEVWTLRIMSAQPRDQGRYECQVNTDPKINFAVRLTVKETDMRDSPWEVSPTDSGSEHVTAAASIMGPREQYVHQGSTVTFTCVVSAPYSLGTRPPRVVDWFHSGRLVSIQADRGGISIDTEKTDFQTTSKLTVAGVLHVDAGNYTCIPSDTRPATVALIVLEGEHTEAMQRDAVHSQASCISRLQHEILLFLFLNAMQLAATR
ncbi:uncharacterized protein LOC110838093 isoform X2 [Zootermopsis nevadensis]|uniref:uncharacterized protein LOC110838093 isoform X2 n=1 Tax=Zootermopsis nevadensis TaxID=136037 RepID=UPI000B8ED7A5|nr:uncharacterized protein LOC110838093 isoform X2 [Zootermopsis nevadensis]